MSIIGIGTDVVKIERVKNIFTKYTLKFTSKILSENEIISLNKIKNDVKKIAFIAKRFSAKEAFTKALGLGIGRGMNFCDIEILNNKLGKPFVSFSKKGLVFFHEYMFSLGYDPAKVQTNISLTDEQDIAQSFVVVSYNG